jgi:hypothetical protein
VLGTNFIGFRDLGVYEIRAVQGLLSTNNR